MVVHCYGYTPVGQTSDAVVELLLSMSVPVAVATLGSAESS